MSGQPRSLRELEAEATAMLVCAALNLPGIEEARGYIQHWVGVGADVPESSARRNLQSRRRDSPRRTRGNAR
jgi:hypothetical protein